MLTDDRQSVWHQFDSGFRAVPCVFARIAKVATVNSRHARGRVCSEFLFCTAISVLFLHAFFVFWVVFGALLTRSRPVLRWLHIASLIWGILTELLPWPCPLTLLENWFEGKARVEPYQGWFLLHYLDRLVYPDISATVLTVAGVLVCVLNLALYGWQMWIARNR